MFKWRSFSCRSIKDYRLQRREIPRSKRGSSAPAAFSSARSLRAAGVSPIDGFFD
jgi:hypothetical protein